MNESWTTDVAIVSTVDKAKLVIKKLEAIDKLKAEIEEITGDEFEFH